jgi:hypothetical protein
MHRSLCLVCCLLASMVTSALCRPFSLLRGRVLLASFTASDICTKPEEEVAITIANTLVKGTGLTTAESEVRSRAFFSSSRHASLTTASSYFTGYC